MALIVKYLAYLKSHLSLLEGTGKILNARNRRTDTDHAVSVELGRKSVGDRAGELFKVAALGCLGNFLDEGNLGFVDIDNKVLGLIGEKILNNIQRGNLGPRGDPDKQTNSENVGIKVKLSRLEINISGQDIVHNNVLNEV